MKLYCANKVVICCQNILLQHLMRFLALKVFKLIFKLYLVVIFAYIIARINNGHLFTLQIYHRVSRLYK